MPNKPCLLIYKIVKNISHPLFDYSFKKIPSVLLFFATVKF